MERSPPEVGICKSMEEVNDLKRGKCIRCDETVEWFDWDVNKDEPILCTSCHPTWIKERLRAQVEELKAKLESCTCCHGAACSMHNTPKKSEKNPEFDFHKHPIEKGELGQLSKIKEELQEAEDAEDQGQELMLLIELSDIVGAAAAVAKRLGSSLDQIVAYARLRSETAERAHRTK